MIEKTEKVLLRAFMAERKLCYWPDQKIVKTKKIRKEKNTVLNIFDSLTVS